MREDYAFVEGATQGVGADRAVAANETFLPRSRRPGAKESAFWDRQ
jgi:hypothetical protein